MQNKKNNFPPNQPFRLAQFIATPLIALCLSSPAYAKDKMLPVTHIPQKDACWCGVAAVEMIEQYQKDSIGIDWPNRSDRQQTLANLSGRVGSFVGTHVPKEDRCGPLRGMNEHDMKDQLSRRLKKEYDYVSNAIDQDKSASLHRELIDQIESNNPPIVNGHTRYQDGTKLKAQHWYVVIGYKDTDNNKYTVEPYSDGYYIHDAAYNSPAAGRLKTLTKAKFVHHGNFVKLLTENNGKVHWFKN